MTSARSFSSSKRLLVAKCWPKASFEKRMPSSGHQVTMLSGQWTMGVCTKWSVRPPMLSESPVFTPSTSMP